MSTSQCAVYQVKETPEYRDVRFRSYEKLRSEGKSVSIENYQQVYIGRIKPGETPADIKTRLQKQRPKNFKGHSFHRPEGDRDRYQCRLDIFRTLSGDCKRTCTDACKKSNRHTYRRVGFWM